MQEVDKRYGLKYQIRISNLSGTGEVHLGLSERTVEFLEQGGRAD